MAATMNISLIAEGLASGPAQLLTPEYFTELRQRLGIK